MTMAHPPPTSPTGSQPTMTADLMAALPASVRLETGRGGLPVLLVDGPAARPEIPPRGPTVTQWAPAGRPRVLGVSWKSRFTHDGAIRGGVPICFPWF